MNRIEKYKQKRLEIYKANKKHEERLKKGCLIDRLLENIKSKGKHRKECKITES